MRIWKLCLGGLCGLAAFAGEADAAPPAEIVPGVSAVEFALPKSLKQWEKRRKEIRQTLWHLLGDLPPRPSKPNVRVVERSRRPEGFSLEKIEFDNGAGATVPGYLCLPDNLKDRAPAILYCHYHGGEYNNGKEEIFKKWPAGVPPAVELTRRGYVVLAIDAYCFGERSGKGPGGSREKGSAEELTMSKMNLWVGRTLWGMMVRDDLIALDILSARPEVDPKRVGVTGMSMGSTRSWWIAALDDRPAAAVCVACLTRYQDLIATGQLRAHGIYYFVPGVLRHFDTEAIVALIAPRPLLTLTGDQDNGSPVSGVRTINSVAQRIYDLYGKPDNFRGVVYESVAHTYTAEMWREMLGWFDRVLKKIRMKDEG
ncbi:acetylxylan esterase [Candidatus Sumerlaeota bacterium]|nr:acetylxylan esterase [Candidatus Sumerlaeota bacterium]